MTAKRAINLLKKLQSTPFISAKTYVALNMAISTLEKLENGTLIELPCKEGENLYYISKHNTIGCFLNISYETILMCVNDYHNGEIKFMATTREQAEAKLKELNNENA